MNKYTEDEINKIHDVAMAYLGLDKGNYVDAFMAGVNWLINYQRADTNTTAVLIDIATDDDFTLKLGNYEGEYFTASFETIEEAVTALREAKVVWSKHFEQEGRIIRSVTESNPEDHWFYAHLSLAAKCLEDGDEYSFISNQTIKVTIL